MMPKQPGVGAAAVGFEVSGVLRRLGEIGKSVGLLAAEVAAE